MRASRVNAFLSVLVLLFGLFTAASAAAPQPPRKVGALEVPIVTSNFNGVLSIQRFANVDGQAMAVGIVTGTGTDAAGVRKAIVSSVTLPVQGMSGASGNAVIAQQTCEILNLVLGPLHLDLLGLVIDLNQVILNITAVAGAGNLLGNLLCAIVGLLDQPSLVDQLVGLLNQLLGALLG